MIHARDKMCHRIDDVFPRPVTGWRKHSFSRGLWPAVRGAGVALPWGLGARCRVVAELLQAQHVDIVVISVFCNAETPATPSLVTCAHTRVRGCGPVHMIARACAVAVVAVLQNGDICYLSKGYRWSNLQRRCNACNTGCHGAGLPLTAIVAQAIENGRKIRLSEAPAGSGAGRWPRKGRSGGWDARAAALAGWLIGLADRAGRLAAPSPGAAAGEAWAAIGAHGNSSTISMLSAPRDRKETTNQETTTRKAEGNQRVSRHHPLVYSTGDGARRRPVRPAEHAPPSAGTPTPKADPRAHLPAHGPVIFWPHGGKQPAKLRSWALAPGWGRASGRQGPRGRGAAGAVARRAPGCLRRAAGHGGAP